ncbi:MAG: biotin/lipoyl-containing protein [Pseudomonadota bacterium]|uniref:Biotin-requiring enzyme n=1 Tax=Parasphingorhabdus marina DSM 22363 TaxID=1123272 RepID=A0A1N6CVX1_9SPHN|nr:biotin/lipoyl-containing protein [Parasphingorhabdus marina]SIN62554.1 Biotin-requiring enzyme [Parasphingorhabdus marina DSM 22363]
MATEIRIPKLGFSMESGILAEWLVPDGSDVSEGQDIYALENDKSTQEVESPASGKLKIIVSETGEEYPVGELIGIIE